MPNSATEEKVHVLILTALQDELEAVLVLAEDGPAGWKVSKDRKGFRCYQRSFENGYGAKLRIAAAWTGEMGPRAAVMRAQQLISELDPLYVAMCGICAGYRGKVALGDVIVADQLYSYDEGKVVAEQGKPPAFLHSIQTFDLQPTWKMDAAFLARELDLSTLSSARPISKATQRRWLLSTVLASEDADGTPPVKHPDRRSKCPGWTEVVKEAQKAGLLELQGGRLSLTHEGREQAQLDDLFHPDGLPDDPPFRVHIGAIATGAAVQEDPELFDRLRRIVRTTLGVEMEGAAIAHAAERFERRLIVVKAVSDHADFDKDDSFRSFACLASAKVLFAFLLKHLEPEPDGPTSTLYDWSPDDKDGELEFAGRDDLGVSMEPGPDGETSVGLATKLRSLLTKVAVLRKALTEERWSRLAASAPPVLLEQWIEVVELAPRDSGAAERLVAAMWAKAMSLNLVPSTSALDGRIDRNALTQVYLEKKDFWACLGHSQLRNVGPRIRAREVGFDWMEGAWAPPHAVAGPLFEFVWEVIYAQSANQMPLDNFDLRWWCAVGGSLDAASSEIFPWPLVDLPSFSEYERMAARWNDDVYPRAASLHALTPNDISSADELACWYVDYHHQLWHRCRGGTKGDWAYVVDHLINNGGDDASYAKWVRALPLLAAPESGLSPRAASVLFAKLKLDDTKRKELHDLRCRRVRDCLPRREPEGTLAAIDANHPDHPWIHHIEKPLRVP